MWEFIDSLRNKSVRERQLIAVGVTVVATSFIIVIWLGTLYVNIHALTAALPKHATSSVASTNSFQNVFNDYVQNSPERQRMMQVIEQTKQETQTVNGMIVSTPTLQESSTSSSSAPTEDSQSELPNVELPGFTPETYRGPGSNAVQNQNTNPYPANNTQPYPNQQTNPYATPYSNGQ